MWHCNRRCEFLMGVGNVTDFVRAYWEWRVTDGLRAYRVWHCNRRREVLLGVACNRR